MTFLPARLPWTSQIPLIGLGYRSGAGKDTVADILVKDHGFVKVSFAAALKRAARDLCGFTEEQVNGTLAQKEAVDPRWGWSARWFMQRFGTEIGRTIDPDFWVKVLDAQLRLSPDAKVVGAHRLVDPFAPVYDSLIRLGDPPAQVTSLTSLFSQSRPERARGVAITDCRFPNELTAVKAWGGVAVEVYRSEAYDRDASHASESSLHGAKFDYVISNGGTLDDLGKTTAALLDAVCTDVVVDRGF